MTDPRVIACAREFAAVCWGEDYDKLPEHGGDQGLSDRRGARFFVTTVILKWLEQPPSAEMRMAADDKHLHPEGSQAHFVSLAYAAMCAQAKKEIGGDHG